MAGGLRETLGITEVVMETSAESAVLRDALWSRLL